MKAVGTEKSGYLAKQFLAAFQNVTLDKHGTDCHTPNTQEILITKQTKKDVMNRYIVEKGKYVLIDDSNISKYMNTKVNMRSLNFCISEKRCNICAGEIYYKLGIENVGLTSSKIAGSLTNLNMKKFHNTTASIYNIDINTMML